MSLHRVIRCDGCGQEFRAAHGEAAHSFRRHLADDLGWTNSTNNSQAGGKDWCEKCNDRLVRPEEQKT